jgi:hypothetical protein
MRHSVGFSFVMAAAVAVCLGAAAPVATFAAGAGGTKPAAGSPKPDSQKKTWTNDDVARLNPEFDANRPAQTAAAETAPSSASSAAPAQSALQASIAVVSVAPLDPQQDPQWYAQQLDPLEAELDGIAAREAQLRQFRATSSGLPTGLVLGAPCEGISTDNLISQLNARRQEISQEIDALGDTARRNGVPPGILVEGRGRARIVSQSNSGDQRAALAQQAREAADELAQIRGTVAGMQEQLSAQGIAMLPVTPGNGGNMTTDLLNQLDSRASALQNAISGAEDEARSMAIPPGELR